MPLVHNFKSQTVTISCVCLVQIRQEMHNSWWTNVQRTLKLVEKSPSWNASFCENLIHLISRRWLSQFQYITVGLFVQPFNSGKKSHKQIKFYSSFKHMHNTFWNHEVKCQVLNGSVFTSKCSTSWPTDGHNLVKFREGRILCRPLGLYDISY